MLEAISTDFALTYPQFRELARNTEVTSEVICRTLHCLVEGVPAQSLGLLLTPSPEQYLRNTARLREWFGFNPENPTWRYDLDLENCTNFIVAEQILIIDRWEVQVDKQLQRADISQWGNRSHLRNIQYAHQPLHLKNIGEWCMPHYGHFSFDYSSGKRPTINGDKKMVVDDVTFTKMLMFLQRCTQSPATKVYILRQVSSNMYVNAGQLRDLFGLIPGDALRADLFTIFYFQLVDIHNEKVVRAGLDGQVMIVGMRQRLGFATFFPFIQPERASFRLDFTQNDQRVAASFIVRLAAQETYLNMRSFNFMDGDGVLDTLATGVPRTWEDADKIPKAGVLEIMYVCAPEDRNFSVRKHLIEKYGHWKLTVAERQVMWWTALSEVPPDLCDFMAWLVGKFPNITEAFRDMDVTGNGQIFLRKFLDRLSELKCQVFAGDQERERMEAIFRFLDPGGEGQISMDEWNVLDQLWQEMAFNLKEFVDFLGRTFDHHHLFLDQAFEALDEDCSDDISFEEWENFLIGQLQYFGPRKIIFNFIDCDHQGTVSSDEFMALERFLDIKHMKRVSTEWAGMSEDSLQRISRLSVIREYDD